MKNETRTGRLMVFGWATPFILLSLTCWCGCANSSYTGGESCGNGELNQGEECDDGNTQDGDGCDATCHLEASFDCGNEVIDPGEECDDGNTQNGDGCDAMCHIEVSSAECGDGMIDLGEECDDGNTQSGDGCDATCHVEASPPECGDGVIDTGEECDDGNTIPGDGCNAACRIEGSPSCGDGVVDAGEECDDGNSNNNDGCPDGLGGTCRHAFCGDGFLRQNQEECDDGNSNSGDGCTHSCITEYCGDGMVQSGLGEQCEGGSQSCTTGCGTTGLQTCGNCTWGNCVPPSETCNAQDDDCDSLIDTASCLVTIYRFYATATDDHMYKTNQTPDSGYVYEASTHFELYTSQVPGSIPIYQLFNGTDHMIAIDPTEASPWYYDAQLLGYAAAPNSWYAVGYAPSQMCRYLNPNTGDHMIYTYVSDADLPSTLPDRVREDCEYFAWAFQ